MKRVHSLAKKLSWMASIVQSCNRHHGWRAGVGFLLVMLLNTSTIEAQVSSLRVGMPSPTAASLGKYGDIPVSLYTGTPNINIPLYEVKGRTLSLPISLSYHAAGVKVEEIPGWMGLGWSLDAGGVITRTLRGVPDDQPGGYHTTGNQLYQPGNWSNNPPTTYLADLRTEQADCEPDIFYFNFAGRSGKFVFGTNDTIRSIPFQKLKINPISSPGPVDGWIIVTEDGTKYTFGAIESTRDSSITTTITGAVPRDYISSWYLTKIESSRGSDAITLTYTATQSILHKLRTYREQFQKISGNCSLPTSVTIDSYSRSYPIRLASIVSPTQTIEFQTSLREDALHPTLNPPNNKQEHKLDQIIVKTNGQVQRKFVFSYGYFNHTNPDAYNFKRLRLDEVWEEAADGARLPSFKFEYNATINLPSRFSNAIDHWGFFNGKHYNTDLVSLYYNLSNPSGQQYFPGANRASNADSLKTAILQKIGYPLGGYTEFAYEAHDYGWVNTAAVSEDIIFSAPYTSPLAHADAGHTTDTVNFTISGTDPALADVQVNVNPNNNSPGCISCPYGYVELEKVGTGIISTFQVSGTVCLTLQPGAYNLIAHAGTASDATSIEVQVIWQEVTRITTKNKTAGGLRIKQVKHHDGINSANDQILKYEYKDFSSDPQRSSGVLVNQPAYEYFADYNAGVGCTCSSLQYYSRSAISHIPLGTTQGSHIGYREVKAIYGANGENGYTISRFRSPYDASDVANPNNTWSAGPRTSYDWKRGQFLNSKTYNSSGTIQQRNSNDHSFRVDVPTSKHYRGLAYKYINVETLGCENEFFIGLTPFINTYEVISEWTHVSSDTLMVFDQTGGNSLTTTKRYFYENANHAQLTRVVETNSDGARRLTSLKYPLDYTNSPTSVDVATIDSLKNKHIHNTVLQKVVRQQKAGQTDSSVYSAMLVKYKKFTTNQFLPYETYAFDSTAFLNLTDAQLFNTTGGTFNKHGQYKRLLTNEQYDAYGNPTQIKDANGISATTVFAYNASLPVARFGNATLTQAVASVFDDGSAAGWSNGVGTWTATNGVYQQTNNGVDAIVQPQRYSSVLIDDAILEADIRFDDTAAPRYAGLIKYIDANNFIRFILRWETGNSVVRIYSQQGANPALLDAPKTFNPNQWYHLRGEIQGNTAKLYLDGVLLVTLTSNYVNHGVGMIGLGTTNTKASFDNVRFYPTTALAFSGSYDSKYLTLNTLSDENGLPQRFTYDNFGRLKTTQDAFGNLAQSLAYYFSSPFSASNPNHVKTTLATNAVQHVRNHDFENGSSTQPDYWIGQDVNGSGCTAAWDNTVSFSGVKSIKADIPAPSASHRVRWMPTPWYDEKVSPKETYRMEVWAKTANGYNGNAKFQLFFHNNAHAYTEGPTITIPSGDREWTKYTLDFTPLSTTDHLYAIYLDFNSSGTYKGTIWYDRANFYELNTTKVFADGLGRDIQTLQFEGYNRSTQAATLYDAFNRINKVTKPFFSADTNFTSMSFAIDSANTWYAANRPTYFNSASAKVFDVNPYAYSEIAYLADPLNRPQKQAAPGVAFRMGTGKEVKFDYLVNTATEVPNYAANLLMKQRQTDENGNVVDTFIDKFGNTVASIVDPTGLNYKTTFQYDVMGNLLASRAPRATTIGDSTKYFYTTLNRLRKKISPDAGTVEYLYDRNGNLRFVKDANGTAAGYFIYYKYDSFNRTLEEGKVNNLSKFTQSKADSAAFPVGGNTWKVKYYYDLSADPNQRNLSGRLHRIDYANDRFPAMTGYHFYSYDNNGNLEWLLQNIPRNNNNDGNGYINARIDYQYDALGKVTKTYYRQTFPPGVASNAFYTWYDYDALGRLERVCTNTIDLKVDPAAAQYTYWPGSQVRRLGLAGSLQGIDYLYNSRDWLTQINHQSLVASKDFGNDTTTTTGMKPDRFGEIIGYNRMFHLAVDADYAADTTAQFNGNISWMTANTYGMTSPPGASLNGWVFKYDKANRLTKGNWGFNTSALGTNWSASSFYDLLNLAYDANGNIDYMTRNNQSGSATNMDYFYPTTSNRLDYISGLSGQTAGNYTYDANGNMTKDKAKLGATGTDLITYDYRNLPTKVQKSLSPSGAIDFVYDGKGQRVSKNNLYYIPGADGRTIAVYDANGTLLYWNIWGLDLLGQRFWKP